MMKKWLLFLVLSAGSISVNADAVTNTKFCIVLGEIAGLSAILRDVGLSKNLTLRKIDSMNTVEDPVLHEQLKRSSVIVVDTVYREDAKVLIPEQLKKAVLESCKSSF